MLHRTPILTLVISTYNYPVPFFADAAPRGSIFFLFATSLNICFCIKLLRYNSIYGIFDSLPNLSTTLAMRNLIIALVLLLMLACKQNNKQIDEQQLLGTWETIEGFDFEEVTFSIEEDDSKTLNLVFGQRANTGSWRIQGSNLTIEGPFDTTTYNEVQFSADTLILVQGNGVNSIFLRKAEEQCNARTMLQSLKDISNVAFSEVADTIIDSNIQACFISIPVEVKDDFSILGKTIAPLVEELPNIGFKLDNELITETQTGYFFKTYRVIVTNHFVSPINPGGNASNDGDISGIYKAVIICYCQ